MLSPRLRFHIPAIPFSLMQLRDLTHVVENKPASDITRAVVRPVSPHGAKIRRVIERYCYRNQIHQQMEAFEKQYAPPNTKPLAPAPTQERPWQLMEHVYRSAHGQWRNRREQRILKRMFL